MEKDLLVDALGYARRRGASRAEIFLSDTRGGALEFRERGLHTYQGSRLRGVGLRVVKGRKSGFSYSQDLSRRGLQEAVERALQAAVLADQPVFPPVTGPRHEAFGGVSPAPEGAESGRDRELLSDAVRAALEADARVKSIKKAELRRTRSRTRIIDSRGLDRASERTTALLMVGVVARGGGEAEAGWEIDYAAPGIHLDGEKTGRAAGRKAAARLGAGRVRAGRRTVVLSSEVVAEFLAFLGEALSGEAVLKKKTLYAGAVGTAQAASTVTILDDPTLPGCYGSVPIDDEGCHTRATTLLEGGVLRGYLHSGFTARALGDEPTGNGFRRGFSSPPLPRAANLFLEPGEGSLTAWRRGASLLLVDEVMGAHTINPVSGDFSVGAAGFEIRGSRRRPVRGATIAGTIRDLFLRVASVGYDRRFFGSVGAPSLLVTDVDVAG